MKSQLSAYWKKRDFGVTAEPRGDVAPAADSLSFVVQKHAARRLHYDLRLELDGTLKSWAVPKGPSMDPHVRRMAVHVEDHPLGYAGFEGVIPAGQYGAGTVVVWDRGYWVPVGDPRAGYRAGKLKFDLHGEKLRGRWNLVRVRGREDERQEPWLLIKENDDEARPATEYDITEEMPDSVLKSNSKKSTARSRKSVVPAKAGTQSPAIPKRAVAAKLPLTLFPQLAVLVDEPPQGDGWVYELKLDGYRIVARVEGDDVRLFTRNGNDWTGKLKRLQEDVRALGIVSAWLDGEIVVLDAKGRPDFQLLQRAFDAASTSHIAYFVFDLPYFGGYDLRRVPLVERRALLASILAGRESGRVRFSAHFEGPVKPLLEAACGKGLEGLIGKQAQAPYTSSRSTSWIKLKCTQRQEFVVGGYTDPKGGRAGFGSLLLGIHDAQGKLRYSGNVGTGFDDATLRSLKARLAQLHTEDMPFAEKPRGVKGHWVKPKLVAEVAFTEWTGDGRVRHPVFHGLRTDKDPQSITREKALHDVREKPPTAAREKPNKGRRAPREESPAPRLARSMKRAPKPSRPEALVAGVRVSNADRVIDTASGATKLDLVRYYDGIAPRILPHLAARPVALVRAPQGVAGELFFQKHGDSVHGPGIKELDPDLWPGHLAMLEIDSREALVAAAQMNTVELHTWNSTTRAIDKPDRVIFDLDPGQGVEWATILEATELTRRMLEMLGLESFLKTSGGKGLHVVVPLTPRSGYDEVRDFAAAVVTHLAGTLPKLFVAKAGAQNRIGRIFVDWLRNGNGATTVCAFSARARPGLGVSVPLAWKELAGLESAAQWNIFNLGERLARLRADPWKDYAKARQTIAAAARRLATSPRRTRSAGPRGS